MSTYVFDHSWQREHDRLLSLEALFDAASERLLADLGVAGGWHCLEVGCGAGGVARWLAREVGPSGSVVAIDLDTRFIDAAGEKNLEVRERDLLAAGLEEDWFDLVHARAVLEHIPDRRRGLERMIAAARPGGWLLIEDVDFGGPTAAVLARYFYPVEQRALAERVFRAVESIFEAAGAESSFGARLAGELKRAGMVNVGGEIHGTLVSGRSDAWVRGSIEQLSGRLAATGLVSADEIELFLRTIDEASSHYAPPLMAAAWGQRPA